MELSLRRSIQRAIEELSAAWNRGDGRAFAARCTSDVDFVNLLGMYIKGRESVAAVHEKILNGPYKNSTLTFSLEHVREVSSDAAVAIVPGELFVPAGPVKGLLLTVATILFTRDGSEWRVASFQNTKREAAPPDHSAVMLESIREKI